MAGKRAQLTQHAAPTVEIVGVRAVGFGTD